jgi:Zn-dependent M28 family amino/carboxypeptidase
LQELQKISDINDSNRSSSASGHELSANYIAQKLMLAGYEVAFTPYTYEQYEQVGAAKLSQLAPNQVDYVEEEQFSIMPFSASGDISGEVTAVDLSLGIGNESTSGCELEDFEKFPKGNVALLQRGTCTFIQKAKNAVAAGATALIIFNQGNKEERKGAFAGTLGNDPDVKITVATLPYDIGAALSTAEGLTINIQAETRVVNNTSYNVIAETKSGDASNVVVLGSHIDSVPEGAGINDNGSGSAGLLTVALRMANVKVNNKLRFAWWGTEEIGLIGSTKYVEGLSEEQKSNIELYLNFDMIGSPNYMIGVFDGNGSLTDFKAPKGSYAIERLFQSYFAENKQNNIEIGSSGRSDYVPFSEAGIPYGGLFTGAEGLKTEEQAALFGGTAGESYDACYHKGCDDINNINQEALEISVNAISFVALSYAHSTALISEEQAKPDEPVVSTVPDSGMITSDIGHDLHHLETM